MTDRRFAADFSMEATLGDISLSLCSSSDKKSAELGWPASLDGWTVFDGVVPK